MRTKLAIYSLGIAVTTASAIQAQSGPPSPGCAVAIPPGPDARVKITEEYAKEVGRDAYFWAWPLVNMHNRRVAAEKMTEIVIAGAMPAAPLNRLGMLTDYVAPEERVATCPNQDVVYGGGSLALDVSAVILQVPDFGERFWVYQVADCRTDGFAQLGKMHATTPGFYLLVGPNWKGEVPKGITQVFRSSTDSVSLGRAFSWTTRPKIGRPSSRCCGRS
jgi:hypothetical protein